MKILIVEDEATLASLLKEELVQWGYLSKKASNFNDILAEVTDFKPDLVLMDVSLPFYNGFYWTEKLGRYHMYRLFLLLRILNQVIL